jgi:hypothetical protein
VSIVDAALSTVDQAVLSRLSHGLGWLRARGTQRLPQSSLSGARALRRPVTVMAVLLLGAGAVLTVAKLARPQPGRAGGTSPIWVGVHEGDSIPGYIALSRSRLTALAAEQPDWVGYALVSLDRYLRPDEVAALLGAHPGVTSVTAYARVPLPDRQTERVTLGAISLPADLVTAMAMVADRKEGDANAYARLAANAKEATLRQIYASNAEVSRAEAAAYRQHCACVFALVVRAAATSLVELSAGTDVRSVDPAPDLVDAAAAVFAPPLPEQVDRAGPPADTGLPTMTPG